MAEATIHTQSVARTATNDSVEVIARLLQGQIKAGMFLRIPLNRMLDLTLDIAEVTEIAPDIVRILLNCDDDPEHADLILAFNFADETLLVTTDGEK